MVGIKDKNKPMIAETIKKFHEANIQTIICTGDSLEATRTFVKENLEQKEAAEDEKFDLSETGEETEYIKGSDLEIKVNEFEDTLKALQEKL